MVSAAARLPTAPKLSALADTESILQRTRNSATSGGTSIAAIGPKRAQTGDVITTLDGRWTASIADVFAAAADAEPGRSAEVVILRDGKEMTLSVTPAVGA